MNVCHGYLGKVRAFCTLSVHDFEISGIIGCNGVKFIQKSQKIVQYYATLSLPFDIDY